LGLWSPRARTTSVWHNFWNLALSSLSGTGTMVVSTIPSDHQVALFAMCWTASNSEGLPTGLDAPNLVLVDSAPFDGIRRLIVPICFVTVSSPFKVVSVSATEAAARTFRSHDSSVIVDVLEGTKASAVSAATATVSRSFQMVLIASFFGFVSVIYCFGVKMGVSISLLCFVGHHFCRYNALMMMKNRNHQQKKR
jgi:hypothetical protein